MNINLDLEEIGVILDLIDEKVEAGVKENANYSRSLMTAYKKMMKKEHEYNLHLISKQDSD
jgi:hypothetical protein